MPALSRLRRLVDGLESWSADHARATALALVLVSALLRALYLAQIASSPLIDQHRWAQSDMSFFDGWARAIAAGDLWSDAERHPYHDWHRDVAAEHFRLHPGDPALDPAVARGRDPGQLLWSRWYGEKTFHQEPLYAYLVAATYALFGADVRAVFVWQLAAGVLTNLLVFALARRLFGPLAGLLAAVLAVACAPLLYYEALLLRETLIVTASLALVYAGLDALERRTLGGWVLFGLVGGLALLLKATLLPLVALVTLVALWRARRELAAAVRVAGGVALGVGLALAPALIRNRVVGAPTFALAAVGPVTFASSNTVDYPPAVGFFVSPAHVPRVMAASEGAPGPTIAATLRTHPDLASYLGLLGRKLLALWNAYEIPNNSNFYLYRLHAPVLRAMPVGFTLVGPLGLLGMVLAWRGRRGAWLLHGLVAASVATMLVFYVLSRFRLPLLAALLPFAAFALVELARWALTGRLARALGASLATLALMLWTARPLPARTAPIRATDWQVTHDVSYAPRLVAARERGDWPAVAALLDDALAHVPDEVEQALATGKLSRKRDARLARLFAELHEQRSVALGRLGQEEGARRAAETARTLAALAAEAGGQAPTD